MKNKPFDLYKFLTENKVTLGKYETSEQNGVYKGVSDIRKTNHDVIIKEGKFQLNTLKKQVVSEGKTIPVASPYEISNIFARFLIGDRKAALKQLDKYKNHSFGIVEPDNGEWLKQFDNLISKMEKAIKSEM